LSSLVFAFDLLFVVSAFNGIYIISCDVEGAIDITDDKKYGDIFQINNFEELSKKLISTCSNEKLLEQVCNDIQINTRDNFEWIKICKKINSFF
jgi:glycosyltransferase involved in cell wall biosynthesis